MRKKVVPFFAFILVIALNQCTIIHIHTWPNLSAIFWMSQNIGIPNMTRNIGYKMAHGKCRSQLYRLFTLLTHMSVVIINICHKWWFLVKNRWKFYFGIIFWITKSAHQCFIMEGGNYISVFCGQDLSVKPKMIELINDQKPIKKQMCMFLVNVFSNHRKYRVSKWNNYEINKRTKST